MTGVQTRALPISAEQAHRHPGPADRVRRRDACGSAGCAGCGVEAGGALRRDGLELNRRASPRVFRLGASSD